MSRPRNGSSPITNTTEFFSTDHLKTDLKGRSVRGGVTTIILQTLKFGLSVVINIVLARMLTPGDYGLVGMVTIITSFVTLFNDLGLSMATVQKENINHSQVSTLFWINVALSVLIALITAVAAPEITNFYNEDRLIPITVVSAIGIAISGFGVQHTALLRRQMKYWALGLNDLVSQLLAVTIALIAAWYGLGYWALILVSLVSTAANTIGVWILCKWRPGLPTWNAEIKAMLSFGGNLTGFSIINYFARNLDNILIGKYWGAQALGLYAKAYQLLLLPMQQINAPLTTVTIPSLSRLQNNPEEFRRYYLKAVDIVTLTTMPIVILMATMSEEIIQLLLGNQWHEVSTIFQILSISATVQPICKTTGWIYTATNNTKQMFRWGLYACTFIMFSFILGLPYGPSGVALCYTVAMIIQTLPCLYFATRNTSIKMIDFWSTLNQQFIASVFATLSSSILKRMLEGNVELWVEIVLNTFIIIFSYMLILLVFFRRKEYYFSIFNSFKTKTAI